MSVILGISGGINPMMHHDPSACIIVNGKLEAAAEEERFVRVKNGLGRIPISAIKYCLDYVGLSIQDVDCLVSPGPVSTELSSRIALYMLHYFGHSPEVFLYHHQRCHAAHSFCTSGYEKSLVLTFDGYGDNLSGLVSEFTYNREIIHGELLPNSSLGMFYSTMASFLGFEPGEGEYKLMGLAPYGDTQIDLSFLFSAKDDESGVFSLDGKFFRNGIQDFKSIDETDKRGAKIAISRFEPWYTQELVKMLGKSRSPLEGFSEIHKHIAASTQSVFEAALIKQVERAIELYPADNICLGGGCALNCVAISKLKDKIGYRNLFVPVGANDSGLSIGAAMLRSRECNETQRKINNGNPYLGPSFDIESVRQTLEIRKIAYTDLSNDIEAYIETAAQALEQGFIIGWFNGRMEFGARALGNRSILANPTLIDMKERVNSVIKFREDYRPFAPSVLEEYASEIFNTNMLSPYMNTAPKARDQWRSVIPSVVHLDGTSRVHTVSSKSNQIYHSLIESFRVKTGVPLLLNTSFNLKNEPIVCTPQDALATFFKSGLSLLFMEGFIVKKACS